MVEHLLETETSFVVLVVVDRLLRKTQPSGSLEHLAEEAAEHQLVDTLSSCVLCFGLLEKDLDQVAQLLLSLLCVLDCSLSHVCQQPFHHEVGIVLLDQHLRKDAEDVLELV